MSDTNLQPDARRAAVYANSKANPMKFLRSDGSITVPDKIGTEVLPPSEERAKIWANAPAVPSRNLYPDGSVYDTEPSSGSGAGSSNHAALLNLAYELSGHTGFASQEFVNSSIQTMSANKVSFDAAGNPFPTRDALDTASVFFFQGAEYTPSQHDYCTVLSDETQGGVQARYSFDGVIWVFQFLVNDTPFTVAQNNAINSGITAALTTLATNLLTNIDVAPTQASNRLVLSGGVYSALGYKQKLVNYTTSEQATGRTDENGDPTYEITITGTTGAAGTWNNIGAAIPGFASLVRLVRGTAKNVTGSYIPHGTTTTGIAFSLTVTSTGQLQEEHTGVPLNNQPVVATIEYTKTP